MSTNSWTEWRGKNYLSVRQIGAIYVLVVLCIIFTILNRSEFFSLGTGKLILNQYAPTGIIGLALILPLATGLYDLSIGAVAGLSGMASAWILANVSANPGWAVLVGIAVALLLGLINASVVIGMKIDSFIGTLATGSIYTAIATALAGDNVIAKHVGGAFETDIALKNIAGITEPVFILLIVAIAIYFVLERSPYGRRTYAVGMDREVARLAGVPTRRLSTINLLVSAVLAGVAGIVATAIIGAGSPSTGPSYLLPAYAIAFLGATQFRRGRFNAWGTVVAVLLLGTGNIGLLIVGGPSWSPDVFDGAMLIAAVGLTSLSGIGPLAKHRKTKANRSQTSVTRQIETIDDDNMSLTTTNPE